ncbi:SMP-30/gluconolactonase/LRE family protein [Phenylobacterium sp. LjRoot219]|uniref:SMP-30/gluconolactonase/LRE family protein n=1 Tax=Phenylobacterium sp. LjRoot219 TaxID=3342283 RepID=UPI003ECE918F
MTDATAAGFEPVARGLYLEGLAVDYERDVVWYSDVIAGGVHGLGRDGRTQTLNPERMWTGGVMLNADGAVLSSGAGGIMWNNPANGKSGWLIHEIDGQVINGINEMMPDGTGGILFGTNDIEMVICGGTPRPSSIYRLTVEGKLIKLAEGINFSNGIMLSADRKQFYCNDTFVCTYAFDVQPDLTLANKRVLLDKEDVDGMALDADGVLWVTGFRSSELTRVRPDGTRLAPVPMPGGAITQIRFGGADMRDVYINTVPADAGDTLKDGGMPTEQRSVLYRGRSEVAGMPIPPARFTLG